MNRRIASIETFALETRTLSAGEALFDFIVEHVPARLVVDGMILVVTSKIVSLAENRLVPRANMAKADLIALESDRDLGPSRHGGRVTLRHGVLAISAGIDESNSESGGYILLPKEPFRSAEALWRGLRQRWGICRLGILLTDSRTVPLRNGISGFALSHWGFRAIQNRVGDCDLFGRELKMTKVNCADALASVAVLSMGEAAEKRPLAVINTELVDFVEETDERELTVNLSDDIYSSIFSSVLLFFFIFLCRSASYGQALPLQTLSSDPLPITFQFEHLGPSLWVEKEGEGIAHTKFDFLAPIVQSGVDAYAVQIRGSRLRLNRDTAAPGTAALVPQELGSVAIGMLGKRIFDSQDVVVTDVAVGRSGVQLGSAETAMTVSTNIYWARPKDENGGQWIYLLSYSNSRTTLNNIPFPGFAYSKSFKTENGQGVWAAGLPFFFLFYRGTPFSGSLLITPFVDTLEGSYSIAGPFAAFVRFGWQPQTFKVNGGPEARVLYEEFRSQLGFRGPVAKWALANLGIAHSNGRRLVWGDSLFRATSAEARLEDELSMFLNLSARF